MLPAGAPPASVPAANVPAASIPADVGPVQGVLLAAGASRRLGEPKQLLTLGGPPGADPLVRVAARALLEAGLPTLVVLPPGPLGEAVRAALAGLPLTLTVCPQPQLGLSESFRAGLAALPDTVEAAHFALGDMPFVSAAMHRQLLDAYRAARPPLVLARYGRGDGEGEGEGVRAPPHIFRRDLFPGFTQPGDHGPRHLIREYAPQAVWVDLPAAAAADLDTPEDLARVRARWAAGQAGGPGCSEAG